MLCSILLAAFKITFYICTIISTIVDHCRLAILKERGAYAPFLFRKSWIDHLSCNPYYSVEIDTYTYFNAIGNTISVAIYAIP